MFFYKSASRYCSYCRRRVLAQHLHYWSSVHVLLTLLTCGVWAPVCLLALFVGRYRCLRCGSWV